MLRPDRSGSTIVFNTAKRNRMSTMIEREEKEKNASFDTDVSARQAPQRKQPEIRQSHLLLYCRWAC